MPELPRQSDRQQCPGHQRHWFSVYGQPTLRSPVCVRCGAPNPRPVADEDLDELERFNRHWPRFVGPHVVNALRALGRRA